MKNQTPQGKKQRTATAYSRSRRFGEWCEQLALDHEPGWEETRDFMAHPNAARRLHRLISELAAQQTAARSVRNRSTWMVVQVGTIPPQDLRSTLYQGNYLISCFADDLLNSVSAWSRVSLKIVRVATAELGFPNGARRPEIYRKAILLGFWLCPSELGPQLRMQYPDQPLGESINVATVPVGLVIDKNQGGIFRVENCNGDLWLSSTYHSGSEDYQWGPETIWVFVKP